MSHRPLHDRRDDNAGAATWYSAISAAAETSDIVFFWAHNHTGESSADTNAYYVAKDGTEKFTVYNGLTEVPNFTYLNAGYIDANGQDPARKPVATTVQITASSLIFQDYTTSGEYTNASYSHNVTVTREFASTTTEPDASEPEETEPTLESIAVTTLPTKSEYTVGEALDVGGMVVTAYYSEDSEEEAIAYTLSEVDMTTVGTKTITVTYQGLTTTFEITVVSDEPTENTVSCWDDSEQVYIEATGLGLTGITATNVTGDHAASCDDVFTTDGYVELDIALEGHTDGNSVAYSISVVPDLDITNLELYYVEDDGTLTPVESELVTDELNNVYVEFTTDKVGTFVYGSAAVPEGYELASRTLANIPTDVFVGTSLDLMTAEITATYTKEGAEDFVRKLTIYDYDEANFSSFDVNVAGKQTVAFTFDDVEATLDIYVWGETFTDETTGVTVKVGEGEYGVTAATVAESANENVATAIAGIIENYVAYDIYLNFTEGYAGNSAAKTVTLPIPEGVTNPVVYFVSDNGKYIHDMGATVSEDGKSVTFTTTYFSAYVLGDGTTIETEEGGQNNTVGSTVTTAYNTETVTVYKLVETPEAGKEYLIVNSNTGTGYGLDGDTTGYSVSAFSAGSDTYYTNWTGDPATSTAFAAGADTYASTTEPYLWSASSGWKFTHDSASLGYSNGLSFGTSSSWTYSNSNTLSTPSGTRTYYLLCDNGTWSVNRWFSTAVYFYEPVTLTKVTTTTEGSEGGTYSVEGTDITNALALAGKPQTLESKLYFTGSESNNVTEVTDLTGWTVTYELVEGKGNTGIITSISDDTATLSGKLGTAVVKVTYTKDNMTVWDEFIVTAAYTNEYKIRLTDGAPDFNDIEETIVVKNVRAGQTTSVWAVVEADGEDVGALGNALRWTSDNTNVATINTVTGEITFTGETGTVVITVYFTCPNNGDTILDTVTYSVSKDNYTRPEDGTSEGEISDFPEYPDEGAVRFDKNATAVGNFSETGIAKVELSMTGVPYSTGSEIDVVVMLDMTGSMSTNGMIAAEEATVAFVDKIVKNEDGTYNKNRVAVYAFNSGSSSPYELVTLDTIYSDDELTAANTAIRTASTKQAQGGTPFDEATAKCQSVLNEAKTTNLPDGVESAEDYDRQQFCVFMSDGGPTSYEGSDGYTYYAGNNGSGDRAITSYIGGYTSSTSSDWTYNLPTEKYTDEMKAAGITVYTVGLLLQNKPSNPAPYSSMTSSTYDSTTGTLTTIGSHYYFTSTILKNMASDESKYIDIFDVDKADDAKAAFTAIALSIREAAKDVVVQDKIAEDYTMVFDAPPTPRLIPRTAAGILHRGYRVHPEGCRCKRQCCD